MDRALREFRVRGLASNLLFLENVVAHPLFRSGECTTRFIDETPDLFRFQLRRDRATKLLQFIPDATRNTVNLAYADVIVTGGKGLKMADNFKLIWNLAKVLGAEVGATRPVVQAGWVEAERQVGQTGKTVRPKLYIAAGVSGAIQHRVGMEDSDVIVAINTDPNAPIFEFAHYGIVGNAMQVLPVLTETFRSYLDKRIRKVA